MIALSLNRAPSLRARMDDGLSSSASGSHREGRDHRGERPADGPNADSTLGGPAPHGTRNGSGRTALSTARRLVTHFRVDAATLMPPSHLVAVGPLALALAACAVTVEAPAPEPDWARRVGFEERATWPSMSLHMDRTAIGGARRMSYLLDDAGIEVSPSRGTEWGIMSPVEECQLDVYLNGQRLQRRGMADGEWLDGFIDPGTLAGMEVHLGPDGPIRHDCGILLLWRPPLAGAEEGFKGTPDHR